MSLFKKFTDFCAGIAAFAGGLFLLQEYMNFKPKEPEEALFYEDIGAEAETLAEEAAEIPGKFKQFFTPEYAGAEYRILFIIVLTLILSALIGRIFKKLPELCFFVSLLPAIEIVYGFTENMLYSQIGLLLIAGALHVAGNVAECILMDKEDGRHRLWIAAKISSLFPAALCLFFVKTARHIPTEEIDSKLPIFWDLAFEMTELENMIIVSRLGWIFFTVFVISLVLYNVYFIDALISAVPLAYSIYLLYATSSAVELEAAADSGGLLSFHPEIFALLAAICFMANLALCVFENNLSRKEQMLLKNQEISNE